MSMAFFIAMRYLKPRRTTVSIITLSSILGVTLGVTVLMVVLAVMTGFTDLMKEKLIATQAHFQVKQQLYVINDSELIVNVIEKEGAKALPVILGPVMMQYQSNRLDPRIIVIGTDKEKLKKLMPAIVIKKGGFSIDHRSIVIGDALAKRCRLNVGDKILLHSINRLTSMFKINKLGSVELNQDSTAYLPAEFIISGIFSVGKYDFDNSIVLADQDDIAELFGLPWGCATSVYGWGKDPFVQSELINKLRKKLPCYIVKTWEEENHQLLGVLSVEKKMMFFLLIFIVLVAAFSITNTLITSVYQKTREIGVLKAIGANNHLVIQIFLLQGFFIGVIGSVVGTLFGWFVIAFRNDILNLVSSWTGQNLFPKEFYFFNELPAHITLSDVSFIVLSSTILCTLGAVLPAIRATKIMPAKALRYE